MSETNTYWENLSKKITDPVQTKNKRPDTSNLEINFITNYFKHEDEILDIGSGSGLIINKLHKKVKHITAVEKFEGFTKYISESPNILVINADIIGFKIRKQFDGILCTGVSQCFNEDMMIEIYNNIYDMLQHDKYFIMRMHCGIKEDVFVSGYSEELLSEYTAFYRHIDKEISILESIGFKSIKTFDIFPDELNVWDNTRHFMFTCKK